VGVSDVTGWTTLPGTLLTDVDWLADRVDRMARTWGCPDRRTNATLWWYSASAVLLGPAVRSLVLAGELVDLSPAAVRFTTQANGYLERAIPGDGVVSDDSAASMITLGGHLDDVLGLIIKPLAATGGAGERSLWAIATDSLASAVLAATTVIPAGSASADHVATSIAAASHRLRPLPRFTEISLAPSTGQALPAAPAVARYVQRGSCCLLYRVPDGKCISCPNQTPAERLARLTRHAESQH
jgi:hypothetical protein